MLPIREGSQGKGKLLERLHGFALTLQKIALSAMFCWVIGGDGAIELRGGTSGAAILVPLYLGIIYPPPIGISALLARHQNHVLL